MGLGHAWFIEESHDRDGRLCFGTSTMVMVLKRDVDILFFVLLRKE